MRGDVDRRHWRGTRVQCHHPHSRPTYLGGRPDQSGQDLSELPEILDARSDGLEHVTVSQIPDELIKRIAEQGVYVVPTAAAFEQFLPPVALERGTLGNIRRLAQAGVTIVAGTDAPLSGPYGESLHAELELLVKAGLTPMQALQAATRNAEAHLGRETDLGTLEPGKLADLIVVAGNPLESISHTRNVRVVIRNGSVLKNALR